MPISAAKPCRFMGCGKLVADGTGWCSKHQPLKPKRDHGSAGKRVTGRKGVKDRERIRIRDHGLCQMCKKAGRLTPGTQVDHITPLSMGGADNDENKQLLCVACHTEKSAKER